MNRTEKTNGKTFSFVVIIGNLTAVGKIYYTFRVRHPPNHFGELQQRRLTEIQHVAIFFYPL